MNQPSIRQARADDVVALAEIEAACWPPAIAGSRDDIKARIAAFSAGQLVIETDQILGAIYGQRINQIPEAPTYDAMTDGGRFANTHRPAGSIYQLVGVSVLPAGRGHGCGRLLVNEAVHRARQMPGVERIVGITRPVKFSQHPEFSLDEYIRAVDESGRLLDPVLEFHRAGGAVIVSGCHGYRPLDEATCGCGVLIEYR